MISAKLKETILAVLELSDYTINYETRADEVPGWDSLTHINIILAIEEAYDIRLPGREVRKLACIGELQDLVDEKLKENDI
ncbi:acyl carrier protein [Mucilaginibacter calamicampi]|uniref:Acyl carrier protein n=1 Tax=Mucilaginibacter calamicampi TaxID=1302352 RepID=A0ABW2YTQ8_9SPHI